MGSRLIAGGARNSVLADEKGCQWVENGMLVDGKGSWLVKTGLGVSKMDAGRWKGVPVLVLAMG